MRGVCLICGCRFDTEQQDGFLGCVDCGSDSDVQLLQEQPRMSFEQRITGADIEWLRDFRCRAN